MRELVIGAGSAGAVVAALLSEDRAREVMLVEAGPDYRTVEDTPFDLTRAPVSFGDHDWGFTAVGPAGTRIPYAQGKVVGGCSAVNVCIALRGEPDDYERWSRSGGEPWSWAAVEPVFRRVEDDDIGGSHHGRGGPVPIRRSGSGGWQPLSDLAYQALAACGYPPVADLNQPGASGLGPWPMNRVDGVRQSTAICYLAGARNRANLRIRPELEVRRILFEQTVAVGAETTTDGTDEVIEADRVWLCAGAVGTPTLLLRSGIGPREQLESAGIACVIDRPGVGNGLIDHPRVTVAAPTRADIAHVDTVVTEVGVRYSSSHRDGSFNDMQLSPCVIRGVPGWPDVLSILVGVYDPRSVGSVRLDPADAWAPPLVDPNFLADRADLDRAVDGVRRAWQVLHTEPLRAALDGDILGLNAEMVADDNALAAFARGSCGTFHHPVGTARLGPAADPGAVVDPSCRVHGARRLHVIDASVMPTIPRANTNLPTIMLAEHAVELVLSDGVTVH